MARSSQGGSVPDQRKKYKSYCFTSYNVESPPSFDESTMGYLIYGFETCPETARRHLQGFVQFKNRQYFSRCKTAFPGAHIERSRGTPEEAALYCRKDGDFREYGTLCSRVAGNSKFSHAVKSAEKGDLSSVKENDPGIYLRYKATLESLRKFDVTELETSCGYWLVGPPRSGKDFAVRSLFKGEFFDKNCNKWWDGYLGEQNVLISDIDEFSAKFMGYYLKIWTDRYAFNAEIKGSHMKIRPKKIFCTSNFKLCDLWSGPLLSALEARFEVHAWIEDKIEVSKRPVLQPSDLFKQSLLDHGVLQETTNCALPSSTSLPVAGPSGACSRTLSSSSEDDFRPTKKVAPPQKRIFKKSVQR